jgi:hypothetical protein
MTAVCPALTRKCLYPIHSPSICLKSDRTATGIVAKEVFDGFGKSLTPMETVIEAFMRCCETSVSGELVHWSSM